MYSSVVDWGVIVWCRTQRTTSVCSFLVPLPSCRRRCSHRCCPSGDKRSKRSRHPPVPLSPLPLPPQLLKHRQTQTRNTVVTVVTLAVDTRNRRRLCRRARRWRHRHAVMARLGKSEAYVRVDSEGGRRACCWLEALSLSCSPCRSPSPLFQKNYLCRVVMVVFFCKPIRRRRLC